MADTARLDPSTRRERATAAMSKAVRLRGPVPDAVTSERYYTDEESAFLRAVETYRTKHGKRFLCACDYLHVIKALGYTLPEREAQ